MIAAWFGHAQVVNMLIDANVNLEAKNSDKCDSKASVRYLCIFAYIYDDFRATVIYCAAERGE